MHEDIRIGRGTLYNPDGDPIKKVDYEITSDEGQGRLRGVPLGLLKGHVWVLEDETNQRWSIEAMPVPIPDDLTKSWINVVVREAK